MPRLGTASYECRLGLAGCQGKARQHKQGSASLYGPISPRYPTERRCLAEVWTWLKKIPNSKGKNKSFSLIQIFI